MYEEYWQLRDKPFRNTPDPRYFYFSRQHEEALARALYVITEGQGGAMLLTGDCGCGKTLITRVLVDELDPARFEAALVTYPKLDPVELLGEILRQFGFANAPEWPKPKMLEALGNFLRHTHLRGASTLIIVDEGQVMHNDETLEEVRLLLNFQQDRSFFLTLLLVGQPELRGRIASLPQLSQRLTVRYHISGLHPEDARKYLRHRLAMAGCRNEVFKSGAETLIIESSGGVPRKLNQIADRALLIGYANASALVDEEVAQKAVDDMH